MRNDPRILFIMPALNGHGGTETVLKTLANGLRDHGISCHIYLIANKRRDDTDQIDDTWLSELDYTRVDYSIPGRSPKLLLHARVVSRLVKTRHIDTIISFDGKGIAIARLASRLWRRRLQIYFWPHVSIEHIGLSKYIRKAYRHLAISNGIADQLVDYGVSRRNITVIYNPVQPTDATVPFSSTTFIFVGRLFERQKRISDILTAASQLRGEWTLHLFGDGPDGDQYRHQAQELGISEQVVFHGFVNNPWSTIRRELPGVGALVLASQWEGFPMVLLEAMAHGIHCISADCQTGPRDIIKPGVNGTLFDTGDVARLTQAMQEVINGSCTRSAKTIKDSVSQFNTDAYVERFISAIRNEHP